jgi:hypothetical protein
VLRHPAGRRDERREVGERRADAQHHHGGQHVSSEVPVDRRAREEQQREGEQTEPDDHRGLKAEAADDARRRSQGEGREGEGRGQEGEAGGERAVPEHPLEVEGREEGRREDCRGEDSDEGRPDGKVRGTAEDVEGYQRGPRPPLSHDEGGEKRRGEAQEQKGPRGEEPGGLGPHDGVDGCDERGGDQHGTRGVEMRAQALALAALHEEDGEDDA